MDMADVKESLVCDVPARKRRGLSFPSFAFLLCLLLATGPAWSQIEASKTSGCLMGGFIVQLKAQETENPNHEYAWTMGNGRTANTYRAVGQYTTAGQYTVTLKITDRSSGLVRGTWSIQITVNENPVVDFIADRTDGCFPHNVNFTDQSVPASGTSFIHRKWTFGNGSETTGAGNPSVTYEQKAEFTPTLRLVQSNCPADTFILQKPGYIRVKEGVTADFLVLPAATCNYPVTVKMQNLSTVGPGQNLRFEWTFLSGTPSTSTDREPSIQYSSPGENVIRLKAISDGGCEREISGKVKIPQANLVSSISTPSDEVCQGNLVSFVNSSTPVPDSSFWYFGGDPPVSGLTQFRRFANVGQVNVTLVNKYGICEQRVTRVLTVKSSPGDRLSTPDSISCKTPHTQRFIYSGLPASQIQRIDWEFGDGQNASGPSPTVSHDYNSFGKFPVRMRVTDIFGCVTDRMFNERVIVEKARVDSVKPKLLTDSGCASLTYRPLVFASSRDGIAKVTWNFGDGSNPVVSNNPTHVYATPRASPYEVTASIETLTGCTIEEKGLVYVGVVPGPAQFEADKFDVCAGSDSVQFTDLSTAGNVTGWKWEFGDGQVSFSKSPRHAYRDTGYMDVRLTLFNNGCPNSPTVKGRYIKVKGAISEFLADYECADKLKVSFRNKSKNAQTYSWDFGDNSPTSNLKDPVHNYPRFDKYTARLTVTGEGCTMVSKLEVTPVGEKADFDIKAAFTNTFCGGNTMVFTALPGDPQSIRLFEWDFGSGVFVKGDIRATYPYPDKGVYRTRLRITDKNGCVDVVSRPPFAVGGPSAGFEAPTRQGCTGLEVAFSDTSISELNSRIVTRIWDFGDGETATLDGSTTKVTHKYRSEGSFNVKLTVVDDKGCRDEILLNKYVIVTNPKIDFSADMTNTCPDKFIRFTNTTKMEGGRFSWDFGDNNVSQAPEPAHRYAAKGRYTVTLNVVDGNGCAASFKREQYINVDIPVSDYDLSETFDDCPPMTPTFTFKGSYHEKIRWEFGDGGVSDLANPRQVYLFPGTYVTRLTVTSPGGCQATSSKTIVIEGPSGNLSSDKSEGCERVTVNFRISNAKDLAEVIWDFDEGTLVNKDLSASYTYTRPGVYRPQVFLKNPKGCIVPYGMNDSIRVIGVDPGFLSIDSALCDKGQARFTDTTRTNGRLNSWAWDFGNGSTSNDRNPTNFYASPGNYKVRLRVTTEEGCIDEVERMASVRVVKSPEMAVDSDPSVCQGGLISFTGRETTVPKDTSTLRHTWDFGNGQTATGLAAPPQSYAAAGNYSVRLRTTNSTGCVSTAVRNIVVNPLPEVGGPDLETICLGQSVRLRPTGALSYQWLSPHPNLSCTSCPDPIANPSVDTRYMVRATNAFGCVSEDSIRVRVVQPSTVTTSAHDSLCIGESAQLRASGTDVFTWSPPTGLSNPNIANPVANPTVSTRYVVTGTDSKGCFTSKGTVDITVFPIPTVDAGRDSLVFAGYSVRLNARYSPDASRYEWTPTTGLSCYDCPNPVASPKMTTNYTVRVFNSGGCTSSDAVTLFIVCKDVNLYMPNTFSPNGDGMNDIYYPRGRGIQQVRSFKIFNRWGEMVYQRENFNANDASAGWDGRYRGRELAPDVFVWIIDVVCDNNTLITQKGDVALVR
jgi:gliding motility-associated-like protein